MTDAIYNPDRACVKCGATESSRGVPLHDDACWAIEQCRLRAELRDVTHALMVHAVSVARALGMVAGHVGGEMPSHDAIVTEVVRLRARASLPVIATCWACGWFKPSATKRIADACGHPRWSYASRDLPTQKHDDAPPGECPFRVQP